MRSFDLKNLLNVRVMSEANSVTHGAGDTGTIFESVS